MTRLQLQSAQQIARMFTIDDVDGRLDAAKRFLAGVEYAIELGVSAGASTSLLIDTAKGAHDACSDLMAGMRRDLDNDGVDPDSITLDLSDLDSLIAQLEATAARNAKRGIA